MKDVLRPAAVCMVVCLLAGSASAQTKKSKAKAATKPKAPVTKIGTVGTAQMPGDNGKIGQAYTLGPPQPGDRVNFTLLSAEYTTKRVVIADRTIAPTADQKNLVLTFSAHNPEKVPLLFRYDSLDFTAVDSSNTNHEYARDIVSLTDNKVALAMELKPAQKIQARTVIVVPADVSIPKLIVKHPNDPRVLRYDLRGLIKPLAPPYADPKDTSGATALGKVTIPKGEFHEASELDIRVDGLTYSDGPISDWEKEEGRRYAVVALTFRNSTNADVLLRYDSFEAELSTDDGETVERVRNDLLKSARDESVSLELKPGQTYSGRIFFEIPTDTKATAVTVWSAESRRLVVDLAGAN